MTAPTTFAELGPSPPMLTALAELGHEAPTAIQNRNRPVHVKLALPSAHGGRMPAGDRKRGAGKPCRKAGKPPRPGKGP